MINKRIFIISALIVCNFFVVISFNADTVVAVDPSQVYVSTAGNDTWNGLSDIYDGTNGPKKTIQNATSVVSTDGTINILAGTYNESNIDVFRNMNFLGAGSSSTILDCSHFSRYFTVGMGVTASFTNLTLTNGGTTSLAGGAIFNLGQITFTNCDITNNIAGPSGGAIYSVGTMSYPTSLAIRDCNFINNAAKNQAGWGGAIINAFGTVDIKNTNFLNNQAFQGGVIYNNYGSGTIQFCQIKGNTPSTSQIFADASSFIDATLNWWGSNNGPGNSVSSNVDVSSWLILTASANPNVVVNGGQTDVFGDLQHDNNNNYYDPSIYGHAPNGIMINFAGDALGTVNPNNSPTVDGQATTTFTAGQTLGVSHPTASIGTTTVQTTVNIIKNPATKINMSNISGNKGAKVNLMAKLLDSANKGINGKIITFSVAGNIVGTSKTNTSGVATFIYTILQSTGSYPLVSSFAGDGTYQASQKTGTLTVPTVTILQIKTAATDIKNYYEKNKVLPASYKLGTVNVSMPQLLLLFVTATININKNNLNPITLTAVNNPASPQGTNKKGNIQKTEYLTIAQNVKNFINSTGRASSYANSSLGKITFAKLVHMYSRILVFYANNNKLPSSVIMN